MSTPTLSIRSVFRAAFANVRGRGADLFALEVACMAPAWAAMTLYELSKQLPDDEPGLEPLVMLTRGVLLLLWVGSLVMCSSHVSVALLESAFSRRAGRPVAFREVYGPAWRATPRMAVSSMVWMLLLVLGMVACFVPMVWAVALWTLAGPVLVAEGLGGFRLFARAHRLALTAWLPMIGLSLAWSGAWWLSGHLAGSVLRGGEPGSWLSLAVLWARQPVDLLMNVVVAELSVAAYLELVEPERTVDAQGIADVFA